MSTVTLYLATEYHYVSLKYWSFLKGKTFPYPANVNSIINYTNNINSIHFSYSFRNAERQVFHNSLLQWNVQWTASPYCSNSTKPESILVQQ